MKSIEAKTDRRGGARIGGGRKPVENKRVTLNCRVTNETLNRLKEGAKEMGVSVGRYVDDLTLR